MTAVKAANGTNITRYGYNTLNQLTSMTDPEGGIERYYYDVRGNMTAKTLRSGTVIGYKYDAANRLIKESSNSAIKSSIEYNRSKDGMLTKTETNPNGVITTTIDKYGRTKSRDVTSNGQTYGIWFNYNEQNLVGTKYIYKKSGTNNTYYGSYKYNYDANDRLSQVVDTENNKNETIVSYTYDANDNVNTVRNANGTTTEYTYNFANLVISMKNKKGSNILSSYEYKYNYDGTQYYKKDHTGRTDTYTYDNLGRLTSESVTGVSNATRIDYTYDPAGNRTRMVESGNSIQTMTIDYTYSHSNKLLKEAAKEDGADNTVLTHYNYDTNGNLTSKVVSEVFDEDSSGLPRLKINTEAEYLSRYQNNFTKTRLEYYNYNVFNQLVSYSNSKGTKASYTYMPDGLRASKTVGGIKTNEVWDGQNIIMEVNSNNEVSKFYEYGLDMVREKNSKTYYNYNAHGDVVQLTNQNGAVTQDYTYDAFGNQKSATNVDNPFRYCGEYYDNETGLIYLRNRYYNPETGRFINEDPIRDGLNWYSYCHSNPVNFYDMYGLADSAHLDVPKLVQHNQSDCWAAVAAMIIVYYDEDKEESDLTNLECDVVNKVEDRTDDAIVNSTNIASENIQPKRWETVNDRLGVESPNKDNYEEGMAPKYYTGYDNVSAMEKQMLPSESLKDIIRREIDAKNPVILFYNDKDNGHFVLVTGYDMKNGKMIVTYNDPASENVDSVERTAGIDEMSSQLPGTSFNYNSAYSTNKVMERVD